MKIIRTFKGVKPYYELTLSRGEFDHLCAGCPDVDRVIGCHTSGIYFCLFNNPHGEISKAFKIMPDGQGYFIYVGAPVPSLKPNIDNSEFDELAQQAYDNLEKAINESGLIPIEEYFEFGTLNMGYVKMGVEKNP